MFSIVCMCCRYSLFWYVFIGVLLWYSVCLFVVTGFSVCGVSCVSISCSVCIMFSGVVWWMVICGFSCIIPVCSFML